MPGSSETRSSSFNPFAAIAACIAGSKEPPGNPAIGDPKVQVARTTLFGASEGNWLAYNMAHDVALPGSNGQKIGFLMYPQAECGNARFDCLDPDTFKYTIKSKELTSA